MVVTNVSNHGKKVNPSLVKSFGDTGLIYKHGKPVFVDEC